MGVVYDREKINVDIYFAEQIAQNIDLEPEPKSMKECKKHSDWPKWKEAICAELNSLKKRQMFGSVNLTHESGWYLPCRTQIGICLEEK
jgi:hypothetical protein